MSAHISEQAEARLTEEAQRQGMSVDTYIALLMSEHGSANVEPEATQPVFEQGLGMFGRPEDAVLIDEVVSLAYAERRRSGKDQPLAL